MDWITTTIEDVTCYTPTKVNNNAKANITTNVGNTSQGQ